MQGQHDALQRENRHNEAADQDHCRPGFVPVQNRVDPVAAFHAHSSGGPINHTENGVTDQSNHGLVDVQEKERPGSDEEIHHDRDDVHAVEEEIERVPFTRLEKCCPENDADDGGDQVGQIIENPRDCRQQCRLPATFSFKRKPQ